MELLNTPIPSIKSALLQLPFQVIVTFRFCWGQKPRSYAGCLSFLQPLCVIHQKARQLYHDRNGQVNTKICVAGEWLPTQGLGFMAPHHLGETMCQFSSMGHTWKCHNQVLKKHVGLLHTLFLYLFAEWRGFCKGFWDWPSHQMEGFCVAESPLGGEPLARLYVKNHQVFRVICYCNWQYLNLYIYLQKCI